MSTKMFFVFAVLMGWCALAYAQTPASDCIPIQGQGWQGCAPIGNNRQSQQPMPPPPRWVNRWGAFASGVSGSPGFGAAVNRSSKRAAEEAALADCRVKSNACKIQRTYHNQCIALTLGNETAASDTGATLEEADERSMKDCKSTGDSQCHLAYSACSYAVRIQ